MTELIELNTFPTYFQKGAVFKIDGKLFLNVRTTEDPNYKRYGEYIHD